jgi:hypothetical protein
MYRHTFMEGTPMVAHYPASAPKLSPDAARLCIKLLDLLTNRYHVGIVHASSPGTLEIDMPLSSRLAAGQRVHFAIADDSHALIPRHAMRPALVRRVHTTSHTRLRVNLSPAP